MFSYENEDVAMAALRFTSHTHRNRMGIKVSYDTDVDVFIKMYCSRHRSVLAQKNLIF